MYSSPAEITKGVAFNGTVWMIGRDGDSAGMVCTWNGTVECKTVSFCRYLLIIVFIIGVLTCLRNLKDIIVTKEGKIWVINC